MAIIKLAPKEVTEALRHHDDPDWLNAHTPGSAYEAPPAEVEDSGINWLLVSGVGIVTFLVLVLVLMY